MLRRARRLRQANPDFQFRADDFWRRPLSPLLVPPFRKRRIPARTGAKAGNPSSVEAVGAGRILRTIGDGTTRVGLVGSGQWASWLVRISIKQISADLLH